jgi:peptidoglycan hydrolase CwlO-like protein
MRNALSGHPIFSRRIISEDDYDIVPKKSFIEKQILQLRENINTITRIRDRTYQRYNQDIEELEAKIAELEGSIKKKGINK